MVCFVQLFVLFVLFVLCFVVLLILSSFHVLSFSGVLALNLNIELLRIHRGICVAYTAFLSPYVVVYNL